MPKKILVIDDEMEILFLLEKFLTKKGFRVITADNGTEGLKIIDRDRSIDLIVLDHRMPKLDGAGVLDGLKMRPEKVPVILLTGSVGKETRDLEVDAFLMKPIDLEELVEQANKLLGGKHG